MWYRLVQLKDWFGAIVDRYKLVRNFNQAARDAFISGIADTLLEAKISKGDAAYRHSFSRMIGGTGLRIKALSGVALQRSQMMEIGLIILNNRSFVRELMSYGWDTLEVHDNVGNNGLKWALSDYAKMGGDLPNANL
jgi:hypothetical protein